MKATHKKDSVEELSPLKEIRIMPDHIFGKIEGFDIRFSGGEVEAKRSYSTVGVRIESEEGGKICERRALAKEVDITAVFELKPLFSGRVFENKTLRGEFELGGEKYIVEGAVLYLVGPILFEAEKEGVYLSERFIETLNGDLSSFQKKLRWVLEFDRRIASAFRTEVRSKERLEKFVEGLADEAERISERFDVKDNPLPLFSVYNKAKEKGVVRDVMMELSVRSMSDDERAGHYGRLIDAIYGLKKKDEKDGW